MSRFRIQYEVEAEDINEALILAHKVVFEAEVDVLDVKVEPVDAATGRTFSDYIVVD